MSDAGKPTRAVVFDLDGTLLDSLPLVLRAFAHALEPFRPRPTMEIFARLGGPPSRVFHTLLDKAEHVPAALERLEAFNRDNDHRIEPFAGMVAMLARLQAHGVRLAVWTGRDRGTTDMLMRLHRMENYFHTVLCGDDLPSHKPNPEGLREIIQRLGVAPEETLMIGDADVDVAAKRIAWLKLLNAGQTCVAPDYVLADVKIRDELVSKIGAAITKFRSNDADGMRIVNQRQFDRLSGYLSGDDGEVTVGGKCDASSLRIQPTVVVDPDPDGPLMRNEIFGPILPVVTVQSLDDAIRFVNSRPKPLSAYLFTKTRETRERVIKEVPAGGMLVNHLAFQVSTAKLPFGGVGASGMGAYHGKFGFEEFSHRKSVLTKPTRPDLSSFIYPPYTERAMKMARRMF